jgi:hypothetical protein
MHLSMLASLELFVCISSRMLTTGISLDLRYIQIKRSESTNRKASRVIKYSGFEPTT